MKLYPLPLVLLLLLCIMPVQGADRYVGGSPALTAYIAGTNEFSPGQDAAITVVIENSGTSSAKYTSWGTLAQTDLPTTAKLVTATLTNGTAPVIVKTTTQSLGDIASPGTTTVTYNAKITSDATLGSYTLPLTVTYRYLSPDSLAGQVTSDTLQQQYTPVVEILPVTIRIKPEVKIDVLNATASNLVVGTEGTVSLTIKNIGYEDGKQATVKLIRNGNSAVIPTDDSVYVGDFSKNGTVTCLYKVSVSSDAQAQSYPVDVAVTYTNAEGDTVTSASDTIGLPVAGKLVFAVSSPPAVVTAGQTATISVTYTNLGSITANKAQARLSPVDPLSGSDQTAYLGDIPPGGSATAQYTVSAASSAIPATYYLDTVVRYRDALDNSQISDTTKAPVNVAAPPASAGLVSMLTYAIIAAAILGAIAYYVFVLRRKQ